MRLDAPEVSDIFETVWSSRHKILYCRRSWQERGFHGGRGPGDPETYNYVVFDDTALKITDKYREGGAVTADHGIGGFIPYMVQ